MIVSITVYVDGISQFVQRFSKLEGVGGVNSVACECPFWSDL